MRLTSVMAAKLISFVGKHLATQIIGLTVARQLSPDLGEVVLVYVAEDEEAAKAAKRFKDYIQPLSNNVTPRVLPIPNLSEDTIRHHLALELATADECYVNITGGSRWLSFICADLQLNPPAGQGRGFKVLYLPQSPDDDHCNVIIRGRVEGQWESQTLKRGLRGTLPAVPFLKAQLRTGFSIQGEPELVSPNPISPTAELGTAFPQNNHRNKDGQIDVGSWFNKIVGCAIQLAMDQVNLRCQVYWKTEILRPSNNLHGDLDLWFVRGARLWTFECKYQAPDTRNNQGVKMDQLFKDLIMARDAGGAESRLVLLTNLSFLRGVDPTTRRDLQEAFGIQILSVDVDDPHLKLRDLAEDFIRHLRLR
jgi:hypothetical protein